MNDINVVLAEYPGLGRVRLCECNSIHLAVGPVTVNLSVEAFAQMAMLIQNAMEQLSEIVEVKTNENSSPRTMKSTHSSLTH
jgi:hypothetical protein